MLHLLLTFFTGSWPDLVKSCLIKEICDSSHGWTEALNGFSIWKEFEKHMSENVVIEMTALRGAVSEYVVANYTDIKIS